MRPGLAAGAQLKTGAAFRLPRLRFYKASQSSQPAGCEEVKNILGRNSLPAQNTLREAQSSLKSEPSKAGPI